MAAPRGRGIQPAIQQSGNPPWPTGAAIFHPPSNPLVVMPRWRNGNCKPFQTSRSSRPLVCEIVLQNRPDDGAVFRRRLDRLPALPRVDHAVIAVNDRGSCNDISAIYHRVELGHSFKRSFTDDLGDCTGWRSRNDRANKPADNVGDHPSGTAFSLFETHQSAITYRRDRQIPIGYTSVGSRIALIATRAATSQISRTSAGVSSESSHRTRRQRGRRHK